MYSLARYPSSLFIHVHLHIHCAWDFYVPVLFCSGYWRCKYYRICIYKKIVFTNCFLFKVQSKVSLKYDSWHKEVLSKFGSLLGNEMVDFHSAISKVNQFKFSSCIKIHTCVKINILDIYLYKNRTINIIHACQKEKDHKYMYYNWFYLVPVRVGAAVHWHSQHFGGCRSDHTSPGPEAKDEELGEASQCKLNYM